MTDPSRIHYLDNLRTFAVFAVVFHHCSVPFAMDINAIGWFIVPDAVKHPLFSWVLDYTDLFQMPLLFFAAGYFAILGLEGKGSKEFLLGKAKRLMLPWLISMFTLVPILNIITYYGRLSAGVIEPGSPMPGVDFYLSGMNGTMHHLWFLPLLFYFCIILLAIRRLPA